MPLTKAQCTNCGHALEVDPAKDAAICPYCGTPYIVEKAIQQVNNNTFIQNATIININKVENETTKEQIELEYNSLLNELEKGLLPFGYHFYKYPKQYYNCFSEEQKLVVERKKQEFYNDVKWFVENFKSIKDFADYLSSNNLICKIVSKEILKKNVETGEQTWESCYYNDRLELKPSSNPPGKILCDDYTDYGIPSIAGFIPEYGVFLYESGSLYYSLIKADSQQFEMVHEFLGDIEKYTFRFESVNSKKGCYIATCVYGSYDCPEVWTLRRFRDYTLATTFFGRAFIKTYYAISPTLVKWFGNKKLFRTIWKSRLDHMVQRLYLKGYESAPYKDKA